MASFWLGFWTWATVHWFLSFILFLALLNIPVVFMKLIVRTYRFFILMHHGWPTMPNMDADGDIVHPKRKAKEQKD